MHMNSNIHNEFPAPFLSKGAENSLLDNVGIMTICAQVVYFVSRDLDWRYADWCNLAAVPKLSVQSVHKWSTKDHS